MSRQQRLEWFFVNEQGKGYQVSEDESTAPDNTNDVSPDVVIARSEAQYNNASQVIASTSRARFEDATGTGPLQGPAGSQPKSRDSFGAMYLDPVGRLRFSANDGTNGGASWTRPDLHPGPSDTVLVSEQRYASDGGVGTRIDPQGTFTTEPVPESETLEELHENSRPPKEGRSSMGANLTLGMWRLWV